MNTKPKISPNPQKINPFDKFAKAFYVFGRFIDMEAPLWQALEESTSLYNNPEKLEAWCHATQYYKEKK